MAVNNAGEDFTLESDEEILKINSPQKNEKNEKKPYVEGPYVVVFKDIPNRWAIVALKWDGKPRLGIRWFWSKYGEPKSHYNENNKDIFHATWLMIPESLTKNILSGLPIDHKFSGKLEDFLCGKIEGDEIKN